MQPDYIRLKEIKPALAGYIKESQTLLAASSLTNEKMVHDVRVLMKKSRATLNLLSPQLDQELLVRDNQALKTVGRLLRQQRESTVLRKTLKDLRKKHPSIFRELSDNERISQLLTKPVISPESSVETKKELDMLGEMLKKTGYRIRFQSMKIIDAQLLLKRLEITYMTVVEIYIKCRNNPKPSNLHEFRKKCKTFLYQLYFFRPLNPPVVKTIEKRLESMTQNLGRFYDLHQLVKAIHYKYTDKTNSSSFDELVLIIRGMQDSYLAKIWPAAYKIFCPGQNLVNVLGFKILSI